jgi:hypothetical protein
VVTAVLAAQTPDEPDWQKAAGGKMAFEVASVNLAKPGTFTLPTFWLGLDDAKPPGGRFSGSFRLAAYISFAYKLDFFRVMCFRPNAELMPESWQPQKVLGSGRGIRPWGCLPRIFTPTGLGSGN